jgi:hypothetical protein
MVISAKKETAKCNTGPPIDGAGRESGGSGEAFAGRALWQYESTVNEIEKNFAQVHFFLACSSDSCILRKRTRFIFRGDRRAVNFRGDRRSVNAAARASFV